MILFLLCMGAGVGGVIRYGLSNLNAFRLSAGIPLGTLVGNIIGSGLLAWAIFKIDNYDWALFFPEHATVLLPWFCVGVSGGLTTFSTLIAETLEPMRHGYRQGIIRRIFLWFVHIGGSALAAVLGYAIA